MPGQETELAPTHSSVSSPQSQVCLEAKSTQLIHAIRKQQEFPGNNYFVWPQTSHWDQNIFLYAVEAIKILLPSHTSSF